MWTLKLFDVAAGALVVYLTARLITSNNRSYRLPPGPKGLPLIGSAREWPKQKEWLTFARWKREYGVCSYMVSNPRSRL
jgi:hypothetical protein